MCTHVINYHGHIIMFKCVDPSPPALIPMVH